MCRKEVENPPEHHYEFWDNQTMRKLGKRYEDYTYKELGEIFGRTEKAVKTRACILRIVVRMSPYADDLVAVMHRKRCTSMKKAAKIRMTTEKGKAQLADLLKKSGTQEAQIKRTKTMKAIVNTPEGRANLEKARKASHSPEASLKRSNSMKATFARKKAERK
jgi:hypothetical protein